MSSKDLARYPAYMSLFEVFRKEFYSLCADSSKVPIFLDLDELDSYPTPPVVKKEAPAATSSKPLPAPKPTTRARASTAKKRKGSEVSVPGPEGFSYDELSFTDSLELMTSFLNKVIFWASSICSTFTAMPVVPLHFMKPGSNSSRPPLPIRVSLPKPRLGIMRTN
ncbi:hypothetical protein HanXRQr2_Chr08g0359681 [Helianthus annuus]|uniref:Uncharacterized protein n=1 Tax=Helianthus annuus TaxID=4232 RepID=A0A9K3IHH2_HELAN|nr:hypothetical protein HanXRQr2_Chr08g0359681 [Helianthus annuus]KAJ0903272.1 hypothetical protein HanPSC8_Chr08g0347181 [Helianthus annuus]